MYVCKCVGERETRVTGDEPQGTIGTLETAGVRGYNFYHGDQ